MDMGVHLLLAHEMLGLGQDGRHPCEFGDFFRCERGATPAKLLARDVYGHIAIPLRGSAWRQTSMLILAKAFASYDRGENVLEASGTEELLRAQRWRLDPRSATWSKRLSLMQPSKGAQDTSIDRSHESPSYRCVSAAESSVGEARVESDSDHKDGALEVTRHFAALQGVQLPAVLPADLMRSRSIGHTSRTCAQPSRNATSTSSASDRHTVIQQQLAWMDRAQVLGTALPSSRSGVTLRPGLRERGDSRAALNERQREGGDVGSRSTSKSPRWRIGKSPTSLSPTDRCGTSKNTTTTGDSAPVSTAQIRSSCSSLGSVAVYGNEEAMVGKAGMVDAQRAASLSITMAPPVATEAGAEERQSDVVDGADIPASRDSRRLEPGVDSSFERTRTGFTKQRSSSQI